MKTSLHVHGVTLQGGQQLLVAVQAEQRSWWLYHKTRHFIEGSWEPETPD